MLDEAQALPHDPEDLRAFAARLLDEVKSQAILIEKVRHQLAGHRAHRFGTSSETAEQLQFALQTSEIAAAAMTAKLRLPCIEEKDRPKRRPIPEHIPAPGGRALSKGRLAASASREADGRPSAGPGSIHVWSKQKAAARLRTSVGL